MEFDIELALVSSKVSEVLMGVLGAVVLMVTVRKDPSCGASANELDPLLDSGC